MDRVGFFGGSFDPIHLGHIHLAVQLLEKQKLNKVIFCPIRCSPDKQGSPPQLPLSQRLEMVDLALKGYPSFSLTTIEEEGAGPSYTVDTLKAFQKKNPEYKNSKFFLLLAQDTLEKFYLWKDVHSLCTLAPPIFGRRTLKNPDFKDYPDAKLAPLLEKSLVGMPVLQISASDIRARIKNKLYYRHLLPPDVLDFIEINKLYS
jgi:nicotinate-nucleotide adenylyltransferase